MTKKNWSNKLMATVIDSPITFPSHSGSKPESREEEASEDRLRLVASTASSLKEGRHYSISLHEAQERFSRLALVSLDDGGPSSIETDSFVPHLGRRLAAVRKVSSASIENLSTVSGLSPTTICRMETGIMPRGPRLSSVLSYLSPLKRSIRIIYYTLSKSKDSKSIGLSGSILIKSDLSASEASALLVEAFRFRAGLGQNEIDKLLNVAPGFIRKIESQSVPNGVTALTLARIAAACGFMISCTIER